MKKTGWIIAALFFCVLSLGCGPSRVADFTVLASKNISTLEGAQKLGVFEGKDCKIAFGGRLPNQKEALDKALEAGQGNAMVDAVIYFTPAVCIFDENCWSVKGTVIKTKDMLFKGELDKELEKYYTKETLTPPGGHEYLTFTHKANIDLDNDKKYYDLIIRVK
jgi:hypothetical protein